MINFLFYDIYKQDNFRFNEIIIIMDFIILRSNLSFPYKIKHMTDFDFCFNVFNWFQISYFLNFVVRFRLFDHLIIDFPFIFCK